MPDVLSTYPSSHEDPSTSHERRPEDMQLQVQPDHIQHRARSHLQISKTFSRRPNCRRSNPPHHHHCTNRQTRNSRPSTRNHRRKNLGRIPNATSRTTNPRTSTQPLEQHDLPFLVHLYPSFDVRGTILTTISSNSLPVCSLPYTLHPPHPPPHSSPSSTHPHHSSPHRLILIILRFFNDSYSSYFNFSIEATCLDDSSASFFDFSENSSLVDFFFSFFDFAEIEENAFVRTISYRVWSNPSESHLLRPQIHPHLDLDYKCTSYTNLHILSLNRSNEIEPNRILSDKREEDRPVSPFFRLCSAMMYYSRTVSFSRRRLLCCRACRV